MCTSHREASPSGEIACKICTMAYRRSPFAVGEFFHCYTRGVDKRITFQDNHDYERFLQALYVCNDTSSFDRDSVSDFFHHSILKLDRGVQIVSVVAYCLMPNHYHLVLRENVEGGIVRFMQKVGTMYTMYFNGKNDRIGGLFVGPFRSKHIDSDSYLRKVISYTHLNPAEIFEPGWKDGKVQDLTTLELQLRSYRFSSLQDYYGIIRPERSIIDMNVVRELNDHIPPLHNVILDAAEYYGGLRW